MTKKESQNKPQIVLSRSMINSFIEVTIPPGTKSLAINENYITDFVGLNSSTKLEYLSIDKNPIISFRGFPSFPNLTYLSLIDTPISKLPNFRALAIAVAGQQLKTLNGIEVSTQDRAAALSYGPTEAICQLIIRGWLPRKPVSLPVRKTRNNADNNSKTRNNADNNSKTSNTDTLQQAMNCRILKLVDEQENDPISVRITRILRAQGYGIPQIREFLHDFFSPHTPKKKETKQIKDDTSIEAQIKKQQQIIDVLAAQLHALRSGNRTFNDYDEMIRTSGINLLRNAEILRQQENGEENIQNNEATMTKTRKKANKPEYELLRSAVIDFLQVTEETRDSTLIKLLDSITLQTDQEEEEGQTEYQDQYQYIDPNQQQQEIQQNEQQYGQQYGQQYEQQYKQQNGQQYGQQYEQQYGQQYGQQYEQQYEQQEQQENEEDYQDQVANQGNNYNNNNEFTEDEFLPLGDDIIPRPDARNVIVDMDEKGDNNINSQNQYEVLVEEEEEELLQNEEDLLQNDEDLLQNEEDYKSYEESEENLNRTANKGINVPERALVRIDSESNKDDDVKNILARMSKIIDEDDDFEEEDIFESNQNMESTENDSNQVIDEVQQSSS